MIRSTLYPGWKMTVGQHAAYFKLLANVYKAQGITSTVEKESMRKRIHERAFGSVISAKEIDRLKMFDAFKAECLAMSAPDDLAAQMRQNEQPIIRLRFAIRQLADENYILAIVQGPRFRRDALDDLDEGELVQLRNTLQARMSAKRKRELAHVGDENVPF